MAKKDRLDVSELKSHLGYRLRVISNSVSHAFALKLATCDVTVAEWVILREMYSRDAETSPSLVAKFTGLTRGAVSKLIERLLQKGLVNRSEFVDDRRFQKIKLTNAALKLVPRLASIADKNDEMFFSILTETEKKQLLSTLAKLADAHKLKTNPIE